MLDDKIFREYDIRGVVNKDIDEGVAFLLGKAFGTLLKQVDTHAEKVSVGRDARLSSDALASQIIKGINSVGIHVIDIGLCPTPLQYFSLFHLNLDGGIMITGSHNPPEYNGFKLSIGKDTIFGREIQKIREIIQQGNWHQSNKEGGTEEYDIVSSYVHYMNKRFSYLAENKYKSLKVVVDAGNGTAGIVAPDILKTMGCSVIPLFCEPDGRFPNHHPDPTVVEYIHDLIETTKKEKADIGIGYDGDADRIGVVDTDGNIIWGDQIMIILARDILKRKPGETFIGDVKCSQLMFDDIEKNGGRPIMWKTGHSLVKDKMRQEQAVLAGEFSGHIFIADDYFGYDDAIYTSFRLVEILKKTGKGIRELLSDIPRLYYTPEIRVECEEELKKPLVEQLVKNFEHYHKTGDSPLPIRQTNNIDGVRVVFEKGWGLVRSSNTQPVIVMRFEAEDKESLEFYRNFLETEMQKTKEELSRKS
jgi:phosphomannomutase/phosphoglucomutase